MLEGTGISAVNIFLNKQRKKDTENMESKTEEEKVYSKTVCHDNAAENED
jgi:hypothetical protein